MPQDLFVELRLSDPDRLRGHAATVRSLLDEFDRIVPASSARLSDDPPPGLREQLAEELVRLGCRLLEYAAVVAGEYPGLPTGRA